jgi:hypothetical protein
VTAEIALVALGHWPPRMLRYDDAEPRFSDGSDEELSAASVIARVQHDAILPALNLPARSWLRLTFDLTLGVPFLLTLWGLDSVRVRLERLGPLVYHATIGNRREKGWQKQKASQQCEAKTDQKEPAHARGSGMPREGQRAKGGPRRQG